jgi:hypothetical protein
MQLHFSRRRPPAAAAPHPQAAGHRSGHGADSVLPPLQQESRSRLQPASMVGEHRIGRYLVSPLIQALENGWFASSVSIRSGSGAATTDRILRLTRLFRCATEAAAFAHAEALQWISASRRPAVA